MAASVCLTVSSKKEYADLPEDKRLDANMLLEHLLNDMAHDVFKVHNAARCQKHCMRNCLFLTGTKREWGKRLMELNKYFPYFPVDNTDNGLNHPHCLPDDELNDISDCAKPMMWHITMLESNLDVHNMLWDKILNYYEKLEMSNLIEKSNRGSKQNSNGQNNGKHKNGNLTNKKQGKPAKQGPNRSDRKDLCAQCGKWHIVPNNKCWTLDKNKSKMFKPAFKGNPKSKKFYMTQEEVSKMIA